MRRTRNSLTHEFSEIIPSDIEPGKIYISMQYATAAHKCCCGCGCEVITPLSPTDWKLIFDGQTISLNPSIGNWSFKCKSHYWIKQNRIVWAESWSELKVKNNRMHDKISKNSHYKKAEDQVKPKSADNNNHRQQVNQIGSKLQWVFKKLWPF